MSPVRLQTIACLCLLFLSPGCGTDGSGSETESGSSTSADQASTSGTESSTTSSGNTGDGANCIPSGVSEGDATRTVDAAAVTASATLLNALEDCPKSEMSFKLVLDTHSIDLLSFDVMSNVRLETSSGVAVEQGFTWEVSSDSSHHREGILRVAAPPLTGVTWLRLTVLGLADVDRVFEWDAALLAHDLP